MNENLNEVMIIKGIKDLVPEISECSFHRDLVVVEVIGHIVAVVNTTFIKKMVISKDHIYLLTLINKFPTMTIAMYEVYENV